MMMMTIITDYYEYNDEKSNDDSVSKQTYMCISVPSLVYIKLAHTHIWALMEASMMLTATGAAFTDID